jgi:hypothetical protein
LLDDGRIILQQLLDSNFSVVQPLVKGKVNGTKAPEAENLKDCVAVVEDSVFGKEWDGRNRSGCNCGQLKCCSDCISGTFASVGQHFPAPCTIIHPKILKHHFRKCQWR